jgi:Domain of unknown function (DUF1992)
MTERKPIGTSFHSWIDQQIVEAQKRGSFDDLPGAGKPIPNLGREDGVQAWLRQYAQREGLSTEDMLPTSLRLRKQVERLPETVRELRSEREVREVVAELNRQVVAARRFPDGPPVPVPLADADAMVAAWRDSRAKQAAARAQAGPPAATESPAPARPRWWRRLSRRRAP